MEFRYISGRMEMQAETLQECQLLAEVLSKNCGTGIEKTPVTMTTCSPHMVADVVEGLQRITARETSFAASMRNERLPIDPTHD